MAIVAADLILYGCANHAEDDVETQGGAIDETVKAAMVIQPSSTALEVISSSASDVTPTTATVTGRLATGAIDTEAFVLTGTTAATGSKVFERVLKVVMTGTAAIGTVTVQQITAGTVLGTLEPGILTLRGLFYDSSSNVSIPIVLYEKIFYKNTHATLTLTGSALTLTDFPAGATGGFDMALASAVDDTETVADRSIAPSSIGSFVAEDVPVSVPGGGNLAAGEKIGAWLRMSLGVDNAAIRDNWAVRLSGKTI